MNNFKVGEKVYVFDPNHRVYERDANGHSHGAPIYREHFVEREIVGETPRSWIVGYPGSKVDDRCSLKYSKKNPVGLYTLEGIDEEIYVHDNAYKIAEIVHRLDYKTLKAIAELVGYKEKVAV